MTSEARAQRLVDEFCDAAWDGDGALSVRHGIAAVLRHLADTEGDPESWSAVPARTLEVLADTLESTPNA